MAGTMINGQDGKPNSQDNPLYTYSVGSTPGEDTVGTTQLQDGAVTDDKLANPKVNKAGDTMTGLLKLDGGLDFGDAVVTDPTDLSKHIKLHNNEWGISIQSGKFNFVTDPAEANVYNFYQGTTQIALVQKSVTDPLALTTKSYVDGTVSPKLTATQGAAVADASGDAEAQLNALLASLRSAGIIAT